MSLHFREFATCANDDGATRAAGDATPPRLANTRPAKAPEGEGIVRLPRKTSPQKSPVALAATMDAADRRRSRRNAGISSPNAIDLVDISPFGCGLSLQDADNYQPGRFIEITFSEAVTARAIIRWSTADRLGVEFSRALGSAQVDSISASLEPIAITPI
jgi:hypothetical protein